MYSKRFDMKYIGIVLIMASLFFTAGASAQMGNMSEKAPREVIDAVASGQPRDVLVLLDDAAIQEEAAGLRLGIGADHDTPEVLAVKKSRYDELKQRAFSGFLNGEHEVLKDYSHLPMTFMRVRTLSGLARLLEQPEVVRVSLDEAHRHLLTESGPLIKQPDVEALGKVGAGTTVAVLDTGVDYTRSTFGSCAAPNNPGFCSNTNPPPAPPGCKVACVRDFAATNDNQLDDDGHGTNVSGIVLGIAPDTRIVGLDVFRADGFAYTSDIIAAINWSISNKIAYNIVAINMSLGGDGYTSSCDASQPSFANAISNARSAGILSAVASGNDNYTNAISSPACVSAAVSVGAVYDAVIGSGGPITWGQAPNQCTDATTAADKVTCFSNSASFLTMLAPGALITVSGLPAGWSTMAGTSQAAPHIAGSIAVLKGSGAFPSDTTNQTVARMTGTGVPVLDTRNGITKPRIDLLAATAGGGTCTFSIAPASQTFAVAGGTGSVSVTAADGCNWTAVSNAAWITITSGSAGSGNGTVNFSVAANAGAARTGTMTIAGQTFTVNQDGTFSISGKVTFGRGSLSGVAMTLSGAANATATTDSLGNYSFQGLVNGVYTVTPGKDGYSFTPASREVTLSGANATSQDFVAAQSSGACTYSITPTSLSFAAAGGTGSVNVTTSAGCNWTAVSNEAWITITAGGSGSGNGTVNYSVAANTGSARTGTMTIAGQTFTVDQSAAGGGTFSISGKVSFGRGSLSGVTMTLSGAANVATTTDSLGNYAFTSLGNGTYTVTPDKTGYSFTPVDRTVTLSGAGATNQDFAAAQSGGACTFSIAPTSQAFAAAGGTGSVGVTTAAGCNWTAVSNAAWITITSGSGGSGNGTVNYSVAANAGSARTGTMTIAGQTFTVNQDGAGGGGAFSISGKVTSGRLTVSEVTMTLAGAADATATTDGNGNYTFTGLANGVYTITPSKTGLTFTPSSRTVTINGANVTGQNFSKN